MKHMKSQFIRALTFMLALSLVLAFFTSCQSGETDADETENKRPQRPDGETTGAEVTLPPIDENDPDAEIKRLYYDALNGNSEGALVLNDGVAYQMNAPLTNCAAGKSAAAFAYVTSMQHSDLRITYFDGDRKLTPFCQVEGCAHDVPWCVSYGRYSIGEFSSNLFPALIVEPESEPDECRLYAIHIADTTLIKGVYGLSETWEAYDPQNSYGKEYGQISVLFEYDLKRGTRRAILSQPLVGNPLRNVDLYYNGKIYCSANSSTIGEESIVLCADNETGEYTIFRYKSPVRAAGVYDGRIIIAAEDGAVFSCSTDLNERKLIAQLEHSTISHQMCGDKLFTLAYSDSDDELYNLYMTDLSSPSPTQELVAENVDSLYTYGKYAYYLVHDRHEYVFQGETYYTRCDGNLYRYDTEAGVCETVRENIVAESEYMYIVYVDDETVSIETLDPIFTEDTECEDLEHYAEYYSLSSRVLYIAHINYDLKSGKLRAYNYYYE